MVVLLDAPWWVYSPNLRFEDDIIKWEHFLRYWPFVRGIHRSPVNSPMKGPWCGFFMFSLICTWPNGWVNNRGTGDLSRHWAHYDVTLMQSDQRFDWNAWKLIDFSSARKWRKGIRSRDRQLMTSLGMQHLDQWKKKYLSWYTSRYSCC